MEIKERKTVDMLTSESVSILTQKFIDVDGVETQVGQNHRCAYVNSEVGRKYLKENEPIEVVNSVLALWGDTPTFGTKTVLTGATVATTANDKATFAGTEADITPSLVNNAVTSGTNVNPS